jgi:hypothetical protein
MMRFTCGYCGNEYSQMCVECGLDHMEGPAASRKHAPTLSMGKDFKEKPRLRLTWNKETKVYQLKEQPTPAMKQVHKQNISSGEDSFVKI